MPFGSPRAMTGAALLVACCALVGQPITAFAAVPFLDDEREFIIAELADIVDGQSYRIRDDLRDERYTVPVDDRTPGDGVQQKQQQQQRRREAFFTYDLASDLPAMNTGDRQTPFAVLPNDRRYYLPEYPRRLEPPDQTNRFHKKERIKSSHEVRNDVYGEKGHISSTKVTTENSSSREVSMDIPQSTYMHVPLSSRTVFNQDDYYFFAKAAGVGLAVIVVMIISTIACYRMQKNNKAAADIEYPAYGITGPNKDISPTGDRRLAQSAQMYHYQHQKQQIIAMETNSSAKEGRCGSITDPDSDDDNEEGDYTVYECPGLAPAGEMEVKNPLFVDDNTPASPVVARNNTSKDNNNTAENGVIPTAPVQQ